MKPRHPRFGTRKGTKNTAAHIQRSVEAKAAKRAERGAPAAKTRNRAGMPKGLLRRAFNLPDQAKMIDDSTEAIHHAMVQAWVGPRGPRMPRRKKGPNLFNAYRGKKKS